jgi:MFS family permease
VLTDSDPFDRWLRWSQMTTPSSSRSIRTLATPPVAGALARSEWSNPHFRRLLVVQMAFGYSFSALLLVPKYAATWLSASAAEIGQLQAVPVVVAVVAAPLCGRWLDRGAWRKAIIWGALITSLSTFAFGAVREFGPVLYVLRGLHGLGSTLLLGGTGSLVTRLVPREHHTRAFGTVGAAGLLMNAVASTLTERLADTHGWDLAFELAGAISLVALGMGTRLPALQATGSIAPQVVPGPSRFALLRAVDYGAAAAGAAFALIATFTQPFALTLGADRVSLLFVGYTLTALLVRLVLGNVAERFGRLRSAVLALSLYALTATCASMLRPGWLLELGLLFGFAHGLAWPTLNALAVEHSPPHRTGSAIIRIQALYAVGSLCAVWGGGFLVERLGYPSAFLIGAAAIVSGAVVLVTAGARDGGTR